MAYSTMNHHRALLALASYCVVPVAFAAIPDQFENFAEGTFADDTALFAAGYVFSDGGGLDTSQVFGDHDGGDGLNDGGIFVDGEAIEGSVTFPFAGTIESGVEYRFGAQLFKSSTSFSRAQIDLLAGGTVVASVPYEATVNGSGPATDPMGPSTTASDTVAATIYYEGTPATAGQTLSFRITQSRGFNAAFDVGIDNWELTTVDLGAPIGDQFETFTGFAPIGYEWTILGRYVESPNDQIADPFGVNPGDAALDGAIYVDGNNAGSPQSTVEHRFDGAMEEGQRYEFDASLFQSSISFGLTTVELISDPGGPLESVVASSPVDLVVNGGGGDPPRDAELVELSYTATSDTAGLGLGFRISSDRDAGGSSSEIGIDGWSLSLVDIIDGDYNEDGVVDAADYTVWRDTFGSVVDLRADGDGSGEIDDPDYGVWSNNYGATAASTASIAVPEPAAASIATLVVAYAFGRRSRR